MHLRHDSLSFSPMGDFQFLNSLAPIGLVHSDTCAQMPTATASHTHTHTHSERGVQVVFSSLDELRLCLRSSLYHTCYKVPLTFNPQPNLKQRETFDKWAL